MRYLKTDLGRAALQSRDPAMAPAVRQVLILCDGKRTEQDLAALLPGETLRQALEQLLQKGLLTRQADAPLGMPVAASPRPSPPPAVTRPAPLSVPAGIVPASSTVSAANEAEQFRNTVTLLTGFAGELGFTARFKAQLAIERANTMAELLALADDLIAQLAERGKVTPTMRSQVQALRQGLPAQG